MNSSTVLCSLIICISISLPSAAEPNPATLSFTQAWEQIQRHNLELSAAQSSVKVADSAASQAGTRPNPELSLEAENFGGGGANSGWDSAETTFLVNQPVETGGKRRARIAGALAGAELSRADSEGCRLELWHTLAVRFTEALQAREQESLAEESARLSAERYRLVSQRVQAGKVAPLEASRAAVESELAVVSLGKARRQTLLAHRQLAVLWGKTQPDFTTLEGRLDSVSDWKTSSPSTESHTTSPELNKANKETMARQAALKQEEARAWPDVVFSAGLRRFEDTGDSAWVGGISLPLPLFDRNRGGIQQARHELSRADQLQQAVALKQQLAREECLVALENAWTEIVVLRDKALPTARDAMEKARAGYEQGKFSYLEWVDAEHSFVTLRARWIETLADYHKARAAMGRLSGTAAGLTFFKQP